MNSSPSADIFRIAATYAGTVIGAGFASGQELMQFFVVYGSYGLGGIILAGIMFVWLGIRIMELGHKLNATGYHQLLYFVCGKKAAAILDILVTISLFGVVGIMIAGAGTVGRDYFGLPYSAGLVIMTILLVPTAWNGIRGISTANMLLTPLLIILMLVVAVSSLSYHGFELSQLKLSACHHSSPKPHWLLSSLLYVSYNIVMGTAVLAPLGASTAKKQTRLYGGAAGGLILALLATLVSMTVMIHYNQVWDNEIPMLYISSSQHNLNHFAYIGMLMAAMFTTALASLFGCVAKLQTILPLGTRLSTLLTALVALVCSQLGFSALIGMLYPLFGYAALWFTVRLIFLRF